MHKDFGEWYRLAGMEPDGDVLPKRWAAIEAFSPSANDVVSLARLFYRLGKPDDEFLAAFRDSFQKEDPAFKMRDNDNELAVLAGAELVHVMERASTGLADLAALSLVCTSAGNLRPPPPVRDIPEIGARYLSQRAIGRSGVADGSDAVSKKRSELFDALTALGGPHSELVGELKRLQSQLSIATEESNMLWWLFSEHSRDMKERWTKFPLPSVALMAGKELADLTRSIPGPIAAMAFLDKVIRCAKKTPPSSVLIAEAINGVSIEWREKYVGSGGPSVLDDLLPISRGVKLSLESPDGGAWIPAFTQATGIRGDAKIAPDVLAYQIFLEALLRRAWKTLN